MREGGQENVNQAIRKAEGFLSVHKSCTELFNGIYASKLCTISVLIMIEVSVWLISE
jgi:hypothetical protein